MRFWSVPPLLFALLCALSSAATLRAGDDPGTLFLQAYRSYQDGAKFEIAGQDEPAMQKFRFCVSLLEQIQKRSPEYEPLVVEYRLKKSRDALARLESVRAGVGAMPPPAIPSPAMPPTAATPPAAARGFPSRIAPYRIPVPGAPRFPSATVSGVELAAAEGFKQHIRSLQSQIVGWKQMNDDLNRRLLESTAREQSALTDVDRTRVRVVEVQAQFRQTTQELQDLREIHDRLAREKASGDRQIAGLRDDLEAARADLEVADEYNGELFAKLERAATFIDSGEKIRTQLLDERQRLAAGLGARNTEALKLASVERERDVAIAGQKSAPKGI